MATCAVLAGAVAGSTWAIAGTRSASPEDLEQMSGTASLPVAPATLWAMTKDASSVCQLVPVCSWAEAVPGKPGTFTIYVNDHESLGGIDPLGMIPVNVTISDKALGESMGIAISIDGRFGSFESEATVTLTAEGPGGTELVYRTISAKGTGLVGRLTLAQMTSTFDEHLAESSQSLADQAQARPQTVLGVAKSAAKRGRTGISATVSMTTPEGFAPGAATGTLTVYVGKTVACTTPIHQSAARCFVRNTKRPATAVAVAEGTFDNGIAFTVAKRIRLKGTSP